MFLFDLNRKYFCYSFGSLMKEEEEELFHKNASSLPMLEARAVEERWLLNLFKLNTRFQGNECTCSGIRLARKIKNCSGKVSSSEETFSICFSFLGTFIQLQTASARKKSIIL